MSHIDPYHHRLLLGEPSHCIFIKLEVTRT
jgi:hypothetical protein